MIFYDWKTFLLKFFKPLKNLTKYHHFLVHSDKPGKVEAKEKNSGHSISVNLLKNNTHPECGQLPEVIPSRGLDLTRQWYLYDNIREFCSSDVAKDVVCPKPVQPKPEINLTNKENKRPISTKRKQSLLK